MAVTIKIKDEGTLISPDSLNIVHTLFQRSTCEFTMPDTGLSLDIGVGQKVEVLEDEYKHFVGSITEIEKAPFKKSSGTGRFVRVICQDWSQIADRRITQAFSWSNRKAAEIALDIVGRGMAGEGDYLVGVHEYLVGDGIVKDFSLGSVESTPTVWLDGVDVTNQTTWDQENQILSFPTAPVLGAKIDLNYLVKTIDCSLVDPNLGPTLKEFKTNHEPISEALTRLCQEINYYWKIDEEKRLVFTEFKLDEGLQVATLNNTSGHILGESLQSRETREDFANFVTVVYNNYVFQRTEYFRGDGSKTSFSLPYDIVGSPVVEVNGVVQTIGTQEETEKQVIWTEGSREITFRTAPINEAQVKVTYQARSTDTRTALDLDSIAERATAEGNTGVYARVVTLEKETSPTRAQEIADSLLSGYIIQPAVVTFDSHNIIAKPGDTVKVETDGVPAGMYIVRQVKTSLKGKDQFRSKLEIVKGRFLKDGLESLSVGGSGTSPSLFVVGKPVTIEPSSVGLEGWKNIKTFGARGDGVAYRVSASPGSTTVTSTSGSFEGMAGKHIAIAGAGLNGDSLRTSIVGVESDTQCTIADEPLAEVVASDHTNAWAGTDDSAAIQSAVDSLSGGGGVVYFPPGKYIIWDQSINIPHTYKGVRFIGASHNICSLIWCGASGNAINFGDTTGFTHYHGLETIHIDITCAGANAVGVNIGPALYVRMIACRITSSNKFSWEDNQQIGLALDARGDSPTPKYFGAYFDWHSTQVQGRFRKGVWLTGDYNGWGWNANTFIGGAIVFELLGGQKPPHFEDDPYIGFHIHQGNQNLMSMCDVENYDVGIKIDAYDNNVIAGRTEANRTYDLWLSESTLTGNVPETGYTGGTYCKIQGGGYWNVRDDSSDTSQIWNAEIHGRLENHIASYARLKTSLFCSPNAYMKWEGFSGSSAIYWAPDDTSPAESGVGDTGQLNIWTGTSECAIYQGSIVAGSTTLFIAAHQWGGSGTPALTVDDVGKKILVSQAGETGDLITTISAVHGPDYCSLTDAAGRHAGTGSMPWTLVKIGTQEQWDNEVFKTLYLNAKHTSGSIKMQVAGVEKMAVDSTGIRSRGPIYISGNNAIVFDGGWGGSTGLAWFDTGTPPQATAVLVNTANNIEFRAGRSDYATNLLFEAAFTNGQIQMRVAGDTKITIDQDKTTIKSLTLTNPLGPGSGGTGISGNFTKGDLLVATAPLELVKINVGDDGQCLVADSGETSGVKWGSLDLSSLTGKLTSSQLPDNPAVNGSITVTGVNPLLITRATGTSVYGGLDIGWNEGKRQWLLSAGVPSAGMEHLAYTEYQDDVYQGVRMMMFRGGNIGIGTTTDDGANKLQVNGNTKITGNLALTGVVSGSLTVADSGNPEIISKNTGSTKTAYFSLQWNNTRQWLLGGGLPGNTNPDLSFCEYTDGTYQGIRLVCKKGGEVNIPGNLTIGTALAANYGGTGQTSYTKGDLLVASGSTTLTKLAVGANGQTLVADSSTTSGLKWASSSVAFSDVTGTIANSQLPSQMQVHGLTVDLYDLTMDNTSASDAPQMLSFKKKGTQAGSGQAMRQYAYLGRINFEGWDGTQYYPGVIEEIMCDESWTSSTRGVTWRLMTVANGSANASTRICVSSQGNTLINTLTDSGSGEALQVNGSTLISGSLYITGNLYINGTLIDLPTNITTNTIPLAKVTTNGTSGYIAVNSYGRVYAYSLPT